MLKRINIMNIIIQEHKSDNLDSLPLSSANDIEPFRERFMALYIEPYSIGALTLTDDLTQRVHLHLARDYKAGNKLRQAVGATIAALLANATEDRHRFGYRPMAAADFTGMAVTYKPFRAVIQAFESLGFLEVHVGTRGSLTGLRQGEATRMRAKPDLFEVALRHGVTRVHGPLIFASYPYVKSGKAGNAAFVVGQLLWTEASGQEHGSQ